MPTNDIDYNHGTYLTNHMGSISHHITPLVVHSLGGGDTHTHTHKHTCIQIFADRSNSKKPGWRVPGLKMFFTYGSSVNSYNIPDIFLF